MTRDGLSDQGWLTRDTDTDPNDTIYIRYGSLNTNTVLNTVVQYGCNTVLQGEWLPVRAPLLLPVATHHADIHSSTAPNPHAGQLQSYAGEKDAYYSHSPHIPQLLSCFIASCGVSVYRDTRRYGLI